ncbi:MAG: hypothetical protein U0270_32540 [Labilithrix sp.]
MRSIVAVFALALVACGSFGAIVPEPEADDDDAVTKKKESYATPINGALPVDHTTNTSPAPPRLPAGVAAFPGSQLFEPAQTPAPAVVVLHGSEGGEDAGYRLFAEELSQAGFVVLALCWSGCSGLPAPNGPLPLEVVAGAGTFLRQSPSTNGKVGVFGFERGGEAALVLTSMSESASFDALATFATTDVVRSDWLLGGQRIALGTTIPVTAFRGAMLITHGVEDPIWPVMRALDLVEMREDASANLSTESHFFAEGGHTLTTTEDKTALREGAATFFRDQLSGP